MSTNKMYEIAKEMYSKIGVDADKVIATLKNVPVSIQCWQGDDVKGFENQGPLTGGIQTTGNYPGAARNIDELRADFEKAASMIPGKKKLSLHAIYLDSKGEKVDRENLKPEFYDSWIEWAKKNGFGLNLDPTCFSHPNSDDGFTLSHHDEKIRKFWINHVISVRKIAEYIGKQMGEVCASNYWIPDGFKDTPVDRKGYRERLEDSLNQIFAVPVDPKYNVAALEGKVFGIGAESCTIGSNDFYLGYCAKNGQYLTLDAGHFHPTEFISDKISTALQFTPGLLLHVSRPVRWDSDHVVIFDDELKAIAQEIVRSGEMDRIHIGLDYFDASINRVAAWVIGARNLEKALLFAMLEPTEKLIEFETNLDYTARLAWLEELKSMPFEAVWDEYCRECGVPCGMDWLEEVKQYEKEVLSKR
ncbi:MAG: L-rhamnose isomerase [Clostridia bacterium]|nr:L-rhamnose isomerase [Clostridia bacterium]